MSRSIRRARPLPASNPRFASLSGVVCALSWVNWLGIGPATAEDLDLSLDDTRAAEEQPGMLGDPEVDALAEPKPGLHEKIHCLTRPKESYALFVPEAYAERDEEPFPLLIVHNPGGNVLKDVKRYQQWAEEHDVLIVGIYRIRNGMPDHHKYPIQDHVLKSLEKTGVRFHPVLKFTIGMSGGSADGFRWVRRKPDIFAGAVMQGASIALADEKYNHLILAYLHGAKDEWSVRGIYEKSLPASEALDRPVKILVGRDRGHDWAPQDQQEAVLTWMLHLAMLTHPKIEQAERAVHQQRIAERMAEAAATEDPAERRAALEPWLELPVEDLTGFGKAITRWAQAVEATLPAEDQPIARHLHYRVALATPAGGKLPAPIRTRWRDRAEALHRQAEVAADWLHRQRYAQLVEAEKRAGLDPEDLNQVAAKFEQLASAAADTPWSDRAATDAAELRKLAAANPKRIGD